MIIVYSISGCRNCERVYSVLENYDDKLIIVCDDMLRLNREEFKKTMFKKTGQEKITFPLCFENDLYIGGLEQLIYYLSFNGDWEEIFNDCEF